MKVGRGEGQGEGGRLVNFWTNLHKDYASFSVPGFGKMVFC